MSKSKKAILALVSLLALVLVGLGIFFGIHANNRKVYTEKIAAGDRFYIAGDYVSAAAAYEEAIRANPSNEGGYVSLARTYSTQGLTAMAESTLQKGAAVARETVEIRRMLSTFALGADGSKGGEVSLKVNINTGLLKTLGTSCYLDYTKQYSLDSMRMEGDGIVVRFLGIRANMYFKNTDKQRFAVNGEAVTSTAVPVAIEFDNPATLLGRTLPISYAELQEAGLIRLEISYFEGIGPVVRFFNENCEILIASDEKGNIAEGAWNRVIPELAEKVSDRGNDSEEGPAKTANVKVDGTVRDVSTGGTVDEAKISFFRAGETEPETEIVTDGVGEYEVELAGGEYTVRIEKEGYETSEESLYLGAYSLSETKDYSISKELISGEIRIVLSWDGVPGDLDSHLEGWTDTGANLHISYQNKEAFYNGTKVAELDLDDTDGYGPETTTIHDGAGVYKFYVHDFHSTGLLLESGAVVTVYLPGGDTLRYDLSDGVVDGYYWRLFTIDHGVVTVE